MKVRAWRSTQPLSSRIRSAATKSGSEPKPPSTTQLVMVDACPRRWRGMRQIEMYTMAEDTP